MSIECPNFYSLSGRNKGVDMDCPICESPTSWFDGSSDTEWHEIESNQAPGGELTYSLKQYRDTLDDLSEYDVTDRDELQELFIRIERLDDIKAELRKELLVVQNETNITIYDTTYRDPDEIPELQRSEMGDVTVEYSEEHDGYAVIE